MNVCIVYSYLQWLNFAKQKLQFTEELAWMWVIINLQYTYRIRWNIGEE